MALEQKLEAILFYKGEPETTARLAKLLNTSQGELEEAVKKLSAILSGRGIQLLRVEDQLELVTAPETSEAINSMKKEEMERELGKAGSETLAIILYRGPVSRADIDYIRGVNSSFILRNLQIRGLVKRIQNPNDNRSYLYEPTPELLKHLGVTAVSELPRYKEARIELDAFQSERHMGDENDESIHDESDTSDEPLPRNTEL